MKKRIVCFGDSNTWGYDPKGFPPNGVGRFSEDVRWTSIMSSLLGDEYTVIEEGQNGRTTVWDDPIEIIPSGRKYLAPCISSHNPFSLIIIMLGSNDLKRRFSVSSRDIAQSASVLANDVLTYDYSLKNSTPKVLLVSPIHVGKDVINTAFGTMFVSDAHEKSKEFAKHYKEFADLLGVEFLDASKFASPSNIDQLHMDPSTHNSLANAMANKVREIIG